MKYSYFIAKREFEREWEKREKEYREAGMSPEAIAEIRAFDWEVFKSDRNYALHISDVPMSKEDEFFDVPSLLSLCPSAQIATSYDIYGGHSRYWWIEELENPCFAVGLPLLTDEDKEILTLYVVEQCTEEEIAKLLGTYQMKISRRLQKIFGYFK